MTAKSTIVEEHILQKQTEKEEYKTKVLWSNVMLYTYLHASFFYALYLVFTTADWKTILFAYIYGYFGELGMTVGMHRLWAHRSFKAKLPLRVLLCCFASISGQNHIYIWCRNHLAHHKFAETDADPHNVNHGLFFAHIGWMLCDEHPNVAEKMKTVSLKYVWADPVVRFQRKLYLPMYSFFCFALPTLIPVSCWSESMWNAFFIAGLGKYCLFLNRTWLSNSLCHGFGYRPYDKNIKSTDNIFYAYFSIGEGSHNYHHVFPWDYATNELNYKFNLAKLFIDFMALIGQAYDLKLASPEMIKNRKMKTGE